MAEFDVTPGFHPFADVFDVVTGLKPDKFVALGIDDFDCTIVEIHLIVLVDQTHVVGLQLIGIMEDQVKIIFISQNDIFKQRQGELRKLNGIVSRLLDPFSLFKGDPSRYAAGQTPFGMRRLAKKEFDNLSISFSHLNNLGPDLLPHLLNNTEDIPVGRIGIRTDHEIRRCQKEKVNVVVFNVKGVEFELSNKLCGVCGHHIVEIVEGLRCGHMMGGWTHAADVGHDSCHFLGRSSNAESFEASEFGHLPEGVLHIPLFIQEDLYLSMTL